MINERLVRVQAADTRAARLSFSERALAFKDCMQHMSSEQTEELQAERDLREKVSTLMTESAPSRYITAHESQLKIQ